MKKVLFAISNLQGGGAEKVLITLLKNIDQSKYQITLLLIFNEGVYLKEIPEHVEVKYLFSTKNSIVIRAIYKLFRYVSPKWIYKWFVKDQYDVEIAFLEGITTKLISGSTHLSSKKLAWVHTDLSSNHLTRHYYKNIEDELEHYKKFQEIIFVSEDAKKGFEKLFHYQDKDRMKVIYNPIDAKDIIERAKAESVTYDDLTICTVGRLIEVKGMDRLIKAHARLIRDGLLHRLVIIGTGVLAQDLEHLCRDLGVKESVQFMGYQLNPYPYIKASDIFVSPSRMEGFSLVVAEALILGKPVLSTRTSGPVEILADGKYGMIVENTDESLYEGLKEMLKNETLRENYMKMSQERQAFFNLEKVLQDVYHVID